MGAVDAVEWACVLCGHHIQNDQVSRAMYLHHILHWLEHSSSKTIQMIQKAAAMGNWWLAASSWQCACSYITSCAELFGETSDHSGDSAPLQLRFGTLWLLAFPKTKITLKGKRFQTVNEIQENITGQLMAIGRTVWGPRYLLWRGLRHHCPMVYLSECSMDSWKECVF